jgi:hypothetical protein
MSKIDKYIYMASDSPESDGITKAVESLMKKLSVGRATVFRWRSDNRIDSSSIVAKIIALIAVSGGDITINDIFILSGEDYEDFSAKQRVCHKDLEDGGREQDIV